jgi:hypothetical protein
MVRPWDPVPWSPGTRRDAGGASGVYRCRDRAHDLDPARGARAMGRAAGDLRRNERLRRRTPGGGSVRAFLTEPRLMSHDDVDSSVCWRPSTVLGTVGRDAHAVLSRRCRAEFPRTDLSGVSRRNGLSRQGHRAVRAGMVPAGCRADGPSVGIIWRSPVELSGQVQVLRPVSVTEAQPSWLPIRIDAGNLTFAAWVCGDGSPAPICVPLLRRDNYVVISKNGIIRYHADDTWPTQESLSRERTARRRRRAGLEPRRCRRSALTIFVSATSAVQCSPAVEFSNRSAQARMRECDPTWPAGG